MSQTMAVSLLTYSSSPSEQTNKQCVTRRTFIFHGVKFRKKSLIIVTTFI